MLFLPGGCVKLSAVKAVYAFIALSTLLLFSGCEPDPTTIVGSVSFLNPANRYQTFPPVLPFHSGNLNDDVAYVRLRDNDGAGTVVWESSAKSAGNTLTPFAGSPTTTEGVYIASFIITLSDSQVAGLTMPLRLEAFLYDAPVVAAFPALNPGVDGDRYSYYSATWEGDPGWFYSFPIRVNEVKHASLSITIPIP